MSKYLSALKGQDFAHAAPKALPKVPEGAFDSFDSAQVATPQKYQAPESSRTRTATPAEVAELRALVAAILPGDSEGQAEALPIALADVDDALVCFRALVAELPARAAALPELPTCEQCRNLATTRDRDGARRCRAAARGELDGVQHRRYCPDPVAGRRCLAFAPLASGADQRNGAERWPRLSEPAIVKGNP